MACGMWCRRRTHTRAISPMHVYLNTQDMNQECLRGAHASLFIPAAVVVLAALSLAPPALALLTLWRVRHRLAQPHMRKVGAYKAWP